MKGYSSAEEAAARKANEAAAERHAAEARMNAQFFGPGATNWQEEARVRTAYVTELHRARREHGRPRIRPRGAGRPRTRRTHARAARANSPPGDDPGGDDDPPGEAGGLRHVSALLGRYLATIAPTEVRS